MPGFSFPPSDNLTPRFVDIPLGPTDRLRSWLGWTIEASPLFGPPEKMLRQESGRLIYGNNSPYSTVEDYPIVVESSTITDFINDGGVLVFASFAAAAGYPTSEIGLPAGALWNNGYTVGVVGPTTPDPAAPPVFFGFITAAQLLALGGANLPHTLATEQTGSGILWNNTGGVPGGGGVVCIDSPIPPVIGFPFGIGAFGVNSF